VYRDRALEYRDRDTRRDITPPREVRAAERAKRGFYLSIPYNLDISIDR
jgi:hypothetical protein